VAGSRSVRPAPWRASPIAGARHREAKVYDQSVEAYVDALVGDLTASSGEDAGRLDAVRAAVAAAVAAGQREVLHAGVGGSVLADARSLQPREAPSVSQNQPLVLRRDLELQPLAGPGALPPWVVGRAAETVGPLVGGLGQSVFVDVFRRATLTSVRRSGSSSPFLVLAGPAPTWLGDGSGELGRCSVWIAASLFDPAAPNGGWVGVTVEGGTIGGAAPTPGAAGVLVIPDGAVLSLDLEIAAQTAPEGSGPGEDARRADVRVPTRVSFALAPAGATVEKIEDTLLTAFGATVRLGASGAPARFVPTLGSLLLPSVPDPVVWQPAECASSLASLTGGGDVKAAGWALPVTVAAPETLGPAAGAGGLALLVENVVVAFTQQPPLPAGTTWLLAQPGLLTVAADAAIGTGPGRQVNLYPDPDGGSGVGGRATFRFADAFPFRYLSSAAGAESVFAQAALDVSLDRPVTATGDRIALSATSGLVVFAQTAPATTLLLEAGVGEASAAPFSFALSNALVEVSSPEAFLVIAAITADSPSLEAFAGGAAAVFPLASVLPTLPDPYASTVTPFARAAADIAQVRGDVAGARSTGGPLLLALVEWDATAGTVTPSLAFSLFGEQAPSLAQPATADTLPAENAYASVLVSRRPTDEQLLGELAVLANETAGSEPGPIALLDVSSAADQFGVRYGYSRSTGAQLAAAADVADATVGTTAFGPSIQGLDVVAPAHTIRVITLPAVQWEPVSGPDPSGPFTPMTFPDSGGESELASRSVSLVPVAPKPAIAQMVSDYAREPDPAGVVASITFPFGIRAVALLDPLTARSVSGATLDLHAPGFAGAEVAGGRQLRATAVQRLLRIRGGGSTSFRGASVQLSNGMHFGVPTGLSPIDPLTDIFNGEFGPSGVRPQVPVERFELSGYGENVFSDWKDDTDAVPSISEVRFDVLVGRTSVEIVQARSILYPYAVRVIRTIKMLRDNSGRVQRTDSGWQPVSDGRYRWPRPDTRTHPGVVLGVTNVANIRDTGQRWTSSGGTELMAVRFDCLVDLDGVVTGAGSSGVPSHDQLGFVQISVNPQPGMAASEFAELIAAFGPLGGAVDAVVDVGGSGQRSRVARVGVGVTPGTTGPEFAMAAWGSPVLPRGGPWSVVRRATGDPAPGPVDATLGVPVIRAGYAGSAPDPASPYRFADPSDLARPDSPAADYALLHATNTQRVLFPRPKVELSGPRASEISSTEAPLLADPFLMTTAVSSFPPVATAIQFPDADFGLRPLGGGDLALDLAHNDFDVTGGDRTIHSAGGNTVFARYRDESGTPATVHIELDSSQPVPWTFALGSVELGLATALLGEVIRFLGRVEASASEPGRFTGGTIHFGGALSAVQAFTDFLGSTSLADLPLGSRNQPSLEIALKIPIVGAPGEPEDIDVGIGTLADADVTVGVKIDLLTGAPSMKFELDGIITGRTPFPPIVAAGQIKFEIESDDSGNVFKFTLGLGAGVQADVGPFKAEAYYFQNDYFVVGTSEIGFGIGIEFKASIDLEIVSAEVDVEAAALMIQTSCTPGTALWLVAQLTIGVDITIAWVIDIDFEYQMQMQSNLDGGPCPAPMV